jgi:crotonobetainyl-CoA:carnitine CoA-transferase CaiB-like acyl-CoA transferase
MLEAMLWTMAEPLIAAQLGTPLQPAGNRSEVHVPHGAYRCAGEDDWIAIAITDDAEWRRLCAIVPGLTALSQLNSAQRRERRKFIERVLAAWACSQNAVDLEQALLRAGIPAAALASSRGLVGSEHLRQRGFWEREEAGVLPGLPWQASFGRVLGPAPALGGDTDAVLRELLGLSSDRIAALNHSGAFG